MTRPADAVRSAIRRSLPTTSQPTPLALVACSGGPDSLALAAGAAAVAGERDNVRHAGWRFGAVIIDHQLQRQSGAVATAAAASCRQFGLAPVQVVPVRVGSAGGPEAAARRARYQALAQTATRAGALAVLLAHTRDDQAETVLLGLARGSGARALSGMPARAPLAPGVELIRPVLALSRQTLAQAGSDWGLVPWRDPHNSDPVYARARVRSDVLPALESALGPGIATSLARTAGLLRDDDDALTSIAAAVLADLQRGGIPGIDCAALAEAPPAIRRRVLHRLVLAAGAPPAAVTSGHLFELDRLICARVRGPISLPGRVVAHRDCGRLELRAGQE